ncbi:MAG: FecR domain-containing protein [Mucilaginibacter sp.]|nr:FecR domain-containing protein [Mucilaginibacter sp.]
MEGKELYLLITRYLVNQTSTEENEKLVDWIAADKNNEQTFEDVKRVWLGHKRSVADSASINALANLHKKMAATEPKQATINKVRRFNHYIRAAAAVVVLAAGWLGYTLLLKPAGKAVYLSETTLSGQKKQIILEDGTKVILGPESSFSYPKVFEAGRRVVTINGEAYFEVSKNPHRPFIVQTPSLNVQVLGTHFNVNARKDETINTVSLLEGKVKVNLREEKNEEYLLKPGQELSVNRNNHQVFQHAFDPASVMGWLNNVLIFRNEDLGAIAPRIEKMYGVKIVFTDQETADTRIYAKFDNQSLVDVMKTICASGTLAYHQEGNKIYINLNADKKQTK